MDPADVKLLLGLRGGAEKSPDEPLATVTPKVTPPPASASAARGLFWLMALAWSVVCGSAYWVESQSVMLWLFIGMVALVTSLGFAMLLLGSAMWLGGGNGGSSASGPARTQGCAFLAIALVCGLTVGAAGLWRLGLAMWNWLG